MKWAVKCLWEYLARGNSCYRRLITAVSPLPQRWPCCVNGIPDVSERIYAEYLL